MLGISRIINRIQHTVRYKVLVLVLFPIVLVMPIALILAIYWGANFSYEQLYIKVNTDLSVSHDVFERIKRDYLNSLGKTAESYTFRSSLSRSDSEAIQQQINLLKQEHSFSYLQLIDKFGLPIHPIKHPANSRQTRQSSALKAAQSGKIGRAHV